MTIGRLARLLRYTRSSRVREDCRAVDTICTGNLDPFPAKRGGPILASRRSGDEMAQLLPGLRRQVLLDW
jgi:hypothetical protein